MDTLQTSRLLLRRFEPGDAGAMMAVFADPEVMQYSDNGVRDVAWIKRWIEGCFEHHRKHGYSKLAVLERDSGAVIGYCGLELGELDGRSEVAVGYRLARAAWGRGYATEAARMVVEHGLHARELARIVATIDPGNRASVRVAEKLGMRLEKEIMLEGYDHPDHLYVISR